MRPLVLGIAAALGLSLVLAPVPSGADPSAAPGLDQRQSVEQTAARRTVPDLRVRRLVTGLDHPWDVRPIGRGRLIFTQRDRATVSIWASGRTRRVAFPSGQVWVSGETGLMGLDVDPGFAKNRRFFTCQGGRTAGGGHDVRVMAWRLNARLTRVVAGKKLIGGFPATSGRHGGCRLLALADGSLVVGTGDAAVGTNPRDLTSLGGKTLRLSARTGKPWRTNPFVRAADRNQRYVFTFGHRNVQGLDVQPGTGRLWSVEQGTSRDDEVNLLVRGGDYGYHPVPGYNESVAMTDPGLPGRQRRAVWSSGAPTLATSGGGFVAGRRWGAYDGTFAVAAQKGERVLFLTVRGKKLLNVRVPDALRRYGRIRTIVDGPGSVIYVTTDNGGDDAILAVRPKR
ncbi:PQQ-dependent sugar dehydrogenase [Nocardioides sp. W7]|uniref:PQQ-dependent sugar dehydrogenase n=1 Tax=Nocardioides sp. W7 TaxID=2931390 RepID=UPI001FD1B7C9|nr:PQQ-dependent sugar dehydrogenase [Nocardioides sp. W7]